MISKKTIVGFVLSTFSMTFLTIVVFETLMKQDDFLILRR